MTMPSDPLLAAVISKLPQPGAGFSADGRTKWLRMMAIAFDVTYGETDAVLLPDFLGNPAAGGAPAGGGEVSTGVAAAPARPKPAPHAAAGFDYYVDADGFARCDFERIEGGAQVPSPKRQVDPAEAIDAEAIYDYRKPRNADGIIWADGTMGARPGMTFAGPG